jgi:DNA-directed RNA polymerase subunit RPC12/RpoP
VLSTEVLCPHCKAPYKGKIPEWVTTVQCPYCQTAILIPRKQNDLKISKVIYVEATPKSQKAFCLSGFSDFMRKKGYALDPVSGLLKMGPVILYVEEKGSVEGPEPYRTKAEKWIAEYMST